MILNQLRFALRIFAKDKVFALLNMGGLTMALTTGTLTLFYLNDNLNYDQHYPDHERVYRYTQTVNAPGVEFSLPSIARELGPILLDEVPGIESMVRIDKYSDTEVFIESGDERKTFIEKSVVFADTNLYDIFPLKLVAGTPNGLQMVGQAYLSVNSAMKYFGSTDVIGKEITTREETFTIAGVYEQQPYNTHLKYDVVISGIRERKLARKEDNTIISEAFWNPDVYIYLKYMDNASPEEFASAFSGIYDTYYKEFGERVEGKVTPALEQLSKIHFYSPIDDRERSGNIVYMFTLSSIGFLILTLASINYVNLSTSRAGKRVAEIGMRKALGLSKNQLIGALLTESAFFTSISFIASLILSYAIIYLTPLNHLIGYEISMDFIGTPYLLGVVFGMFVLVAIGAGYYPAWYLASFPLVKSLKGTFQDTHSNTTRMVLLVVQLCISLSVIIMATFMDSQLQFANTMDMGYDKEQIMAIPIRDSVTRANAGPYIENLTANNQFIAGAGSSSYPGSNPSSQVFLVEGPNGEMLQRDLNTYVVTVNYVETMGLEIVEGRDFDINKKSDFQRAYLINERAVRELDWEDGPLGKKIQVFNAESTGEVIGVFKDFNNASIHHKIAPMAIRVIEYYYNNILLKFDAGKTSEAIEIAETTWKELPFVADFEYEFLSDSFRDEYEEDQRNMKLVSIFSIICIMISLLGLTGTVGYDISRRQNEVGIRKVMGASNVQVFLLYLSKYIRPLLIAIAISIPLSNFLVTEWLKNFSYQVSLDFLRFALPCVLVVVFVVVIVIVQSVDSVLKNPIEDLR